jgi:hypothetical protein
MKRLTLLVTTTLRGGVVAVGYVGGLMVAGMVAGALGGLVGLRLPASASSVATFGWLIVASILLGVFLGVPAARLTLRRWQHFLLWSSLVFGNLGSVTIEGAYFAPELVPIPIPVLLVQQALAALGAALAVVLVFASIGPARVSWRERLRARSLAAWGGRLTLSALSYLAFYLVFGALNYALVTRPYYEAHAGGLTVPPLAMVLAAEVVRAPLIVLSVVPYLLSERGTRRQLVVRTGWLLFAVGGIVPLVLQAGTLPTLLLAASALEIFGQNFLTGAVTARLLGFPDRTAARPAADLPPRPAQAVPLDDAVPLGGA